MSTQMPLQPVMPGRKFNLENLLSYRTIVLKDNF